MKVLIVDDEALARERLRDMIAEDFPEHTLLEAGTGLTALEMVGAEQPDLILLDIRMPEMDGLEVARHLLNLNQAPVVVFTTAYQEHALSAFDTNAVDYLVKPIRRERLVRALTRASSLRKAQLAAISHTEPGTRRRHLSATIHGKLQLQPVDSISFMKAEQKYVTAHWPGGEMLLDESLKSLESEFAHRFTRIHRNTLVATDCISGLEKDEQGNVCVLIRDLPDRLQISRRHLSALKKMLKT